MRQGLVLFLLGVGLLVLSACSNSPRTHFYIISGHVQNYTGGTAVVEASWVDDTYGTGTIEANGDFRVEITLDLNSDELPVLISEFIQGQECSSITTSPTTAKGTFLPTLAIVKAGQQIGAIGQSSSTFVMDQMLATDYNTPNAQLLGRVYVNQATSISGNCPAAKISIDLNLKKGWNEVYVKTDANGYITLSNQTSTLDWWYVAF